MKMFVVTRVKFNIEFLKDVYLVVCHFLSYTLMTFDAILTAAV